MTSTLCCCVFARMVRLLLFGLIDRCLISDYTVHNASEWHA